MQNPWTKASGKAKAPPPRERAQGKTARAPQAHAARTNEKEPTIVTKIPIALYRKASPNTRSRLRDMIQEDVNTLADEAEREFEERAREQQHAYAEEARAEGLPPFAASSAASSSNSAASPRPRKKTKRGNDVPMPSPEDLLTGERDGSEHAKVLLSPLSYGRTERAQRMRP